VPLYIWGNRFLPQEAVSWAVVLVAVPLMLTGFFRYNDMVFEQFALEVINFYASPQKRIFSYEPPFMEFRSTYLSEELSEEIAVVKESKKFFRR
jgi:hypothetical protein